MSDIAKLEEQITELREAVERKDLALKLEKNPEFSKLILDIFCEEECARFVRNSTDPAMPESPRRDALAMAQAAGYLRHWLSMQVVMGRRAEDEIKNIEENINELRHEAAEGRE